MMTSLIQVWNSSDELFVLRSDIQTRYAESVLYSIPYNNQVNMTGYSGSRDYVGSQQSTWRTSFICVYPIEKQTLTLSWKICAGRERFEVKIDPQVGVYFLVGNTEMLKVLHGDCGFPK